MPNEQDLARDQAADQVVHHVQGYRRLQPAGQPDHRGERQADGEPVEEGEEVRRQVGEGEQRRGQHAGDHGAHRRAARRLAGARGPSRTVTALRCRSSNNGGQARGRCVTVDS